MSVTLLSDNFNRADSSTVGAPSVGPTPVTCGSASFTPSAGDWGITSNRCAPQSVVTENMILWDVGQTTYTLQATIAVLASGGTNINSVIFRSNGTSNFWMLQSNSGGAWELYNRTGGFSGTLASGPSPYAGQVVKVDVTTAGMEVFFDGVSSFTYSDTLFNTNTYVGFRAYNGSAWDDLTVVGPDIPVYRHKPQRAYRNISPQQRSRRY